MLNDEIQKNILEELNTIASTPRRGIYSWRVLGLPELQDGEVQYNFDYLIDSGLIKIEKKSGSQDLFRISNKGIDSLKAVDPSPAPDKTGKKFKDLFKQLETRLKGIAGVSSDATQFKDIIDKAKKNNPYVEYKEDIIWDMYGLRNVFSHCDRDKYIAEVNNLAFEELNTIIKNIENPPKAGDVFKTEMFTATLDDDVYPVLKKMKEEIYTHVPIYDFEHQFIGILNESTVLNWLVANLVDGKANFSKKQLSDFDRNFLHTDENKCEFITKDLDVFSVQKMFDKYMLSGQRLGCVVITSSGDKSEDPLGIITAWDLPEIRKHL
jgi:CBS domain-containing protein